MFKKLKDKIAEEVKSSPQRFQQLQQFAQAAVTSASSSISDISNNDLFTIADEETPQNSPAHAANSKLSPTGFQDISLSHTPSPNKVETGSQDTLSPLSPINNMGDDHVSMNTGIYPPPPGSGRMRRLSNSSAASDVSFRLPQYETPGSMYHLQSDLDVSASEMEDNISSSVPAQLEKISKEHLYAAYKRTNEKYNKYRGRYTDLARHYRNLERENAKARAVLVETQDKALRRISELREQCALEQSAKAHLEGALRMDLDERNIKIDALNTKIKLLQSYSSEKQADEDKSLTNHETLNQNGETVSSSQNSSLIDFSSDSNDNKQPSPELLNDTKPTPDVQLLNIKIEKLEQLLAKFKETNKNHKEKHSQLSTELQILSGQMDKTNAENAELKEKIQDINSISYELNQSKNYAISLKAELDNFEKDKSEEVTLLKQEITSAKNEVTSLNQTIEIMKKREEENMISLAENKLSVHKELETKEKEIKDLKNKIVAINAEVSAGKIIIKNLEKDISSLKEVENKLKSKDNELKETNEKMKKLQNDLFKYDELEKKYNASIENMKCTELQLKQEIDEKLATIDRNSFLEERNKQLSEENSMKTKSLSELKKTVSDLKENSKESIDLEDKITQLVDEKNQQLNKYNEILHEKEKIENELKSENLKTEELNNSLKLITNENNSLKERLEKTNQNFKELQIEKKSIEESLDNLKTDLSDFKNNYIKLENEKQALEASITELESKYENKNTSMKDAFDELQKTVEGLQKESIILKSKNSDLENFKNSQDKVDNINEISDSLKQKEDEYNCLLEKNNESLKEIEMLSKKLNTINNNYHQIESEKVDLERTIENLETENAAMKSKADDLLNTLSQLQNEILSVQQSHSQLVLDKNSIEEKIKLMEKAENSRQQENESSSGNYIREIDELKNKMYELNAVHSNLISENGNLKLKIEELTTNNEKYFLKINDQANDNQVWEVKLSTILDENNSLQEKYNRLKQEKEATIEKCTSLEQKLSDFDSLRSSLQEENLEKEFLEIRVTQLEKDYKEANELKTKISLEKESIEKKLNDLEIIQGPKTDEIQREITKLTEELSKIRIEKLSTDEKYNETLKENTKLLAVINDHEEIIKKNDKITDEKQQLQEQVNKMKNELSILNQEIEEQKANNEKLNAMKEKLQLKCDELEEIKKHSGVLKSDNEKMTIKIKVLERVESEHNNMVEEYHKLKEEKSKLASDIEGLQAHLTKVSKDNSLLNDKLRDMIANSDVVNAVYENRLESSKSNDMNMESKLQKLTEANSQLLSELKASENLNSRILELERENSILIEEKLELQDQIKASVEHPEMFTSSKDSDKNAELNSLRQKHKDILMQKADLESRLADMELISRSGESNVKLLEQRNEKLKLSHEKLERRLDEALVSLNHIRTLEENTELEYLRNILYEYLTGPTNNNLVLAKVLSAVVKFDQRQTQLVLEREKERQSLLGQLGLL